ncbi:alpha-galactosidase [Mucilaginibacter sp. OK098]|uniref:alpha-galactosidase n=1 Tax=Mucilaginibacter sp. OK098 TaxID=1855297 RepID=UPI000916FF18|nr:alpha-galactosidase [Mucilaginibacter sp. OK098]SHL99135.1 alpha-galactosidase [Mucilaginibacter sp. OK098]
MKQHKMIWKINAHSLRLAVLFVVISLQSLIPVFAKAPVQNKLISMSYGNKGTVTYDLKSGTFTIYKNNSRIVYNAYSSVKINGKTLSSKDYPERSYSHVAITDGFGKGEKHVITLSNKDIPQMKQVFYTYPGRDFLTVVVEVAGKDLKSNYMVPLTGNFVSIKGDAKSVFFPFDNDTFISYEAKQFTAPGSDTSAEVGAVFDNQSRNGIIAGSLEHGIWKTGVRTAWYREGNQIEVWAGYSSQKVTRDEIAHGEISGSILRSPRVFVGYFSDWRNGLEEYGKANRIADPPFVFNWTKPTPVGWNSWGVIQDKLTFEKAVKVADFFADSLAAFRIGKTVYIDLDSYWDKMVKGSDFSKLKQFADYCKSKGLQPGVYWAPFTDWGHKAGPDRKAEGSNYKFGDLWTRAGNGYHDLDGARALDPTHPGTLRRIDYFIGQFKACGFKMIKIDFLGHAAVESSKFYDTTVTTGMQAYRKGMEYLIHQLDGQMLVYAAISPSLATGRYVHSRRIACDAFQTIAHTKYTLNSVTYGWWQTYLYNYLDADHVVLDHQSEGENRARMLSSIITGTFITGDDFSEHGPWSKHARQWYQNKELLKIIENGRAFTPVDAAIGTGTANMFSRRIGNYLYVAVFNYDTDAKTLVIDAKRIGLQQPGFYEGTELLQGGEISFNNHTQINVPGADARLFKFKVDPKKHGNSMK